MKKIAVIGSGTMGHTIALSAIWAGFDVSMCGRNQQDIEMGKDNIYSKLQFLRENDLLQELEIGSIMNHLDTTDDMEKAAATVDIIFEAVPEDIELKRNIFTRLDKLCPKNTILASNTSGLKPTDIASDVQHPERILVAHFWNPAHLIPLVEVVSGEQTDNNVIVDTMNILKCMRKKPIEVKKEVLGFVGNRLQYALFREAQYLLEQNIASKEDIDAAVTYSIGRRLPETGPLMTADMGGLDVFSSISNYLFSDLSNASKSLPVLQSLVDEEHLGYKNGEGFYHWETEFAETIKRNREKELIHFLKKDMNNKRER